MAPPSAEPSPDPAPSPRLAAWLAAALATSAALLLAVLYLVATRGEGGVLNLQRALAEPGVREAVIAELLDRTRGIWDTHNDPSVGRVMQPGVETRNRQGVLVETNRYGQRERPYELPKPAGTVRVVLVGDSFVFGTGIQAEERCGALLEGFLQAREPGREIEVLHLAAVSWNAIAECAYVRRQLGLLQPDVVVQVLVTNDIDDMSGVRGFGGLAAFTPQHRERADSLVRSNHPNLELGVRRPNALLLARDAESRERYARAAAEIERLAAAVEARGGRYVACLRWPGHAATAREHLVGGLRPEQVIYLSQEFAADPLTWIAPDDAHWNRAGMETVAKILYAHLQGEGLLPELDLPPWPEAERAYREVCGAGRAEAQDPLPRGVSRRLDARLSAAELDGDDALHVGGGVDLQGLVSPYATLTLRAAGSRRLRLAGRSLPRPELDGAKVAVRVDEVEVGELRIRAGQEIDESWPLPAALAGREYVTVRFQADDWVLTGPELQKCAVFELEEIALEP